MPGQCQSDLSFLPFLQRVSDLADLNLFADLQSPSRPSTYLVLAAAAKSTLME